MATDTVYPSVEAAKAGEREPELTPRLARSALFEAVLAISRVIILVLDSSSALTEIETLVVVPSPREIRLEVDPEATTFPATVTRVAGRVEPVDWLHEGGVHLTGERLIWS